jgi:hypothetical protein
MPERSSKSKQKRAPTSPQPVAPTAGDQDPDERQAPPAWTKEARAVELGRGGGLAGQPERSRMSPQERSDAAEDASRSRWGGRRPEPGSEKRKPDESVPGHAGHEEPS